jgi:taurine dioxygenase
MGRLNVRRLGYALGAEIKVDLTVPLDDETIAEIKRAWSEHLLLCFPGQNLNAEEQEAFCEHFGALDATRSRPNARDPGHPAITVIVSKPITMEGRRVNASSAAQWHQDLAYTDEPALGTFLLAKELPGLGGDTMFANQYMAYETLSPAMQKLVESLEGIYDFGFYLRFNTGLQQETPQEQAERLAQYPSVVHPIVRVHPETGRKALYVGAFLKGLVGMTDEEARPLIDYLDGHATRYEFIYRHRWTVNDLIMWDNRCVLHYAVQDYDHTQLRRMQRCVAPGPKSGYFLRDLEARETVRA